MTERMHPWTVKENGVYDWLEYLGGSQSPQAIADATGFDLETISLALIRLTWRGGATIETPRRGQDCVCAYAAVLTWDGI